MSANNDLSAFIKFNKPTDHQLVETLVHGSDSFHLRKGEKYSGYEIKEGHYITETLHHVLNTWRCDDLRHRKMWSILR